MGGSPAGPRCRPPAHSGPFCVTTEEDWPLGGWRARRPSGWHRGLSLNQYPPRLLPPAWLCGGEGGGEGSSRRLSALFLLPPAVLWETEGLWGAPHPHPTRPVPPRSPAPALRLLHPGGQSAHLRPGWGGHGAADAGRPCPEGGEGLRWILETWGPLEEAGTAFQVECREPGPVALSPSPPPSPMRLVRWRR